MDLAKGSVESVVTEIAEDLAPSFDCEIVDVTYKKEGGQWFLRVFIDKPNGVTIEDCSLFSQALSSKLDEVDPIPGSYMLEVSSPGVERPLKKPADFQRFCGEEVQVRTYAPIDGRKNWRGRLVAYEEGTIKLDVAGKEVSLPLDKVAKAHLTF
ncbi:MAG: ribosome maturation factor RimP [Limnochordia bacterium]